MSDCRHPVRGHGSSLGLAVRPALTHVNRSSGMTAIDDRRLDDFRRGAHAKECERQRLAAASLRVRGLRQASRRLPPDPDQLHPPRAGVAEPRRASGFPRTSGRTRRPRERAERRARCEAACADRAGRVPLRHVKRRAGVEARGPRPASVRRTAKVLEHDGCALLSFAPCRACARVRRQAARRSPPKARRAFERGAPGVACRCHAVFDDGVAFGTLRNPDRRRQTIHTSQHRLAELRDRFCHRRFFE